MSQPLDGERTVSDVAKGKKSWFTPARKAGLIGVGTMVAVGFIFWKDPGHKKEDPEPPAPAAGISQTVTYDPPKPPAMPAAFAVPPNPPPPPPPPAAQQQQAEPLPAPKPASNILPSGPKERPARMLSYATPESDREHGAAGRETTEQAPSGTHVTYKGAEIVGAKAGAALDQDLLLMPGIIHCILDTGVNSTFPGPLMCHLDAPVISSGNVVLMEKGTRIIGSYSADVKQGQYRMMAVSATAYTPNGIPVPLGGPFADGLGVTGLEASNVDNHVLQRFGGAVMLSLAEGAMSIAQSAVSKGGGNSYISFSSGGVGSLAQEVLRNTIDIPPTITKNIGEEVSLWVLTPISFEGAYKLKNR